MVVPAQIPGPGRLAHPVLGLSSSTRLTSPKPASSRRRLPWSLLYPGPSAPPAEVVVRGTDGVAPGVGRGRTTTRGIRVLWRQWCDRRRSEDSHGPGGLAWSRPGPGARCAIAPSVAVGYGNDRSLQRGRGRRCRQAVSGQISQGRECRCGRADSQLVRSGAGPLRCEPASSRSIGDECCRPLERRSAERAMKTGALARATSFTFAHVVYIGGVPN
jgi:hypothetical protein